MPPNNPNSMQRFRKNIPNQPPGNQNITKDFYMYVFSVASIANGATETATVSIQANSAFVVNKLTYYADIAGAVQTDSSRVVPLVTVAINDSGSGRNFQNEAVPIVAMAGTGELPFILPQPRILMPSSSITATFENISNATTYANLTLAMIGYQIFEY